MGRRLLIPTLAIGFLALMASSAAAQSPTWNSGYGEKQNDWTKSIEAMSGVSINAAPLISHRFKLSDNMKAFDLMKDRKEYYNKVMFIND